MAAARVGMSGLRQVVKVNNPISQNLYRLSAAAMQQTRTVTTQKYTKAEGQSHLASQRLQRPVAPHLTIYDPAQTWFGASIMNRFTGMIFTGSLYGFSLLYLAAPLTGMHLESATLAAAFGGLPVAVKASLKFLLAWPFTFHLFNGTRHLVWDTATAMSKKTVNATGYGIGVASILAAVGIVAVL